MRNRLVSLMIALLPVGAAATPTTIYFAGIVPVQGGSFIPGPLAGVVNRGDPVYGTIVYDDSVPDSDPSPTLGEYVQNRSGLGIDAFLGGVHVTTDPTHPGMTVRIGNDRLVQGFTLDSFGFVAGLVSPIHITPATPTVPAFVLTLYDTTATVFDDDSLPLEVPPLSAFDPPISAGGTFAQGQLQTLVGQFPQIFVNFHLTEFTVIPEPATAFLVGSGLAAVAARRRRAAR